MAIVFSLGGSLFEDKELIKSYADYFTLLSKTQKVGVVVGGGKLARGYIEKIKHITDNEVLQHLAGISATQENAHALCKMLYNSNKVPAFDFAQAFKYSQSNSIVVMGGTIPYLTTDSNTIILAELLEANKVINLTNVDYLYDKDPKQYKNAKKITKIGKKDFLKFVLKNDKRRPGEHFVVDTIAAFILEKTRSALYIINGRNFEEVKNAVAGKKFKGTMIK